MGAKTTVAAEAVEVVSVEAEARRRSKAESLERTSVLPEEHAEERKHVRWWQGYRAGYFC